jgi:bacillithiol biosynthesis deacetylase BshB1
MSLDLLALAAHPDDIELGCAGTLIKLATRGYRTAAFTLTAGESGTRGTPEIRKREYEAAAKIMRVAQHGMLDIPDAGIEETQLNRLKLVRLIRQLQPRLVATMHWEARHPDHIHASHLVRDAAMISGLKNLDLSPLVGVEAVHDELKRPWRPFRVLYTPERYEIPVSFIVDISDTYEEKMRAVLAHESQFHGANMHKYGAERTSISRPEFLEFIAAKNRQWGAMIGVKYGEAFIVRESVRIDDPVTAFGEWCAEAIP